MSELAELAGGLATVYEASGREALIDVDLHQVIPGPERPVPLARCAAGRATT